MVPPTELNMKTTRDTTTAATAAAQPCHEGGPAATESLVEKTPPPPKLLVHCSGGIGRSGTFLSAFHHYSNLKRQQRQGGQITHGDK